MGGYLFTWEGVQDALNCRKQLQNGFNSHAIMERAMKKKSEIQFLGY